MTGSRIPVITYHGLDDHPSPLFVSPHQFELHLKALADAGRKTLLAGQVLDLLRRNEPLPAEAVVITFDDGYESVFREAWPRLRAFGFTATVFLVTDYCGRDNRWPGQPASVPIRPLLSWTQVGALSVEGCEFGAHTRTHPALVSLPLSQALTEILESQVAISERIGQKARVFAYPYGAANSDLRQIVRDHFDGALGTRLGMVQGHSDRYDLERIDAYYLTPGWIQTLNTSGFRLYLYIRRILRSTRRLISRDWQRVQAQRV
jgi:peptidoglycan/xylan/chitin deacetylase (PgdA/CDA1 family)